MRLVIRKEQLAAFQLDSDVRWYEGQLADLYPPFAAAPSAERSQWIHEGIRRAAAVGLGRPEVFQFLCFEQTFSPGCLEDPAFEWARHILAEPGESSADRMKHLRHETIRRLLDLEAREQPAQQPPDDGARAAEEVDSEPEAALLEDASQ